MGETFGLQAYSVAGGNLLCVVDGDCIYQIDVMGGRKPIGRTMAAYTELEQTTTEYYNKLVELKVIVPPKTQEETIAELQRMVLTMGKNIELLNNKLDKMGGKDEHPDSDETAK